GDGHDDDDDVVVGEAHPTHVVEALVHDGRDLLGELVEHVDGQVDDQDQQAHGGDDQADGRGADEVAHHVAVDDQPEAGGHDQGEEQGEGKGERRQDRLPGQVRPGDLEAEVLDVDG